MRIELNGEQIDTSSGTTIAELVATLELPTKRYAVEVNEDLVPHSQHAEHVLNEGDKIEVVQAIGGG